MRLLRIDLYLVLVQVMGDVTAQAEKQGAKDAPRIITTSLLGLREVPQKASSERGTAG